MSITSHYYGRTQNGEEIYQYILENAAGMRVAVIEYGCVITNIWVKDNTGELRDVALGYSKLEDYELGGVFGAFIGRYANRIEKSRFTLDGKTYELEPNNGPNHLHGTYAKKVYKGSIVDGSLVLSAALVLFAFATIIGWNFYGECAVRYLWGEKGLRQYHVLYILAVYLGAVLSLDLVWTLSDLFNSFMALPNLLCLWMLRRVVIKNQ